MSVDQCSNEFAVKWQSTIEAQNFGVGSAKYSHAREWFRNGYNAALKQGAQKPTANKTKGKIKPCGNMECDSNQLYFLHEAYCNRWGFQGLKKCPDYRGLKSPIR